MTETIEELEKFKFEMIQQLKVLVEKQANIMFAAMKSFLGEMKTVEMYILNEFHNMLNQQPFRVEGLGPELATLAKK